MKAVLWGRRWNHYGIKFHLSLWLEHVIQIYVASLVMLQVLGDMFDGFVKSQEFAFVVIPSRIGVRDDGQAGIQYFRKLMSDLDPGFRLSACVRAQAGRGDDFLRDCHI